MVQSYDRKLNKYLGQMKTVLKHDKSVRSTSEPFSKGKAWQAGSHPTSICYRHPASLDSDAIDEMSATAATNEQKTTQ